MVFNKIVEFWDSHGDPRTSQWFLTKNLYPICGIIIEYFAIVFFALPKIFKGEKHPKFEIILAGYYFLHSVGSFIFIIITIFLENHDLRCKKLVQTFDPDPMFEATCVYYWLCFKVSELLETFLLIICNGKATIFNISHHSCHAFFLTIFLHFYPGGPFIYYGLINNIDHAIIYAIITLRYLSPKFKKNSDSWYAKFAVSSAGISIALPVLYLLLIKSGGDCTPLAVKISGVLLSFFGLLVFIFTKWAYISKQEIFGTTKPVIWINSKINRF